MELKWERYAYLKLNKLKENKIENNKKRDALDQDSLKYVAHLMPLECASTMKLTETHHTMFTLKDPIKRK